tara:strand:- start:688 stop:975 length:288 start_codon:yes stop_codon:yes gene_type:complete
MAKKDETLDITPKPEKISDGQLVELKRIVETINKMIHDVGNMTLQKHHIMHQVAEQNDNLIKLQTTFREEYGTHDVDLATGTINYPTDEQTDKKD